MKLDLDVESLVHSELEHECLYHYVIQRFGFGKLT
jgi:hypothetical protein